MTAPAATRESNDHRAGVSRLATPVDSLGTRGLAVPQVCIVTSAVRSAGGVPERWQLLRRRDAPDDLCSHADEVEAIHHHQGSD